VILEHLPGKRLSECSATEVRTHIAAVLRTVSQLRTVTFDHYGEIVGAFAPVGNHKDLAEYVKAFARYYQSELDKHLTSSHRGNQEIAELLRWASRRLDAGAGAGGVESALTDRPCLCHSDIKLTDILVDRDENHCEYFLVDFDNVFAFVPEFDLCKLHLSMLEYGVQMELVEYAGLIASAYGVTPGNVLRGLRSLYPLVLCRLLAWAAKRDHETMISRIIQAMHLISSAPPDPVRSKA